MKQKTNEEFIADLMQFSRRGALMHAFIFQALDTFSARVSKLKPSECETTMVSGEAWHDCGVELQEKLKARLG